MKISFNPIKKELEPLLKKRKNVEILIKRRLICTISGIITSPIVQETKGLIKSPTLTSYQAMIKEVD